jgi:hypothetical protein
MHFKFINQEGKEINIDSLTTFIELIKNKQITSDTLLYDDKNSIWKKAVEFEEFQAVIINIKQKEDEEISTPITPENLLNVPIQEKEKPKNKFSAVTVAIFFISVVMLLLAIVTYYPNKGEGFVYMFMLILGESFFLILVSYFIWNTFLGKKKGTGLLCFSIIFFLLASYHSIKMFREVSTTKKSGKEMVSILKDAMSGKEIKQKDFDDKTYGQMAPILKLINDYLQQIQTDILNMNKEIEEQQIHNMLSQQTLENPILLSKAQVRLQKVQGIINKYEILLRQRIEGLIEGLTERIGKLDVSSNFKKEFLTGFNEKKDQGIQNLLEVFKIKKSFIYEMDNLLNFMKSKQGKYGFKGKQIMFVYQEDANEFNRHMQILTRLAAEETNLSSKVQNEGLTELRKIENVTK